MKKTVVIGISSGIAAYKILNLIRSLHSEDVEIKVVVTDQATKMVSPADLEKESGNAVFTSLYPKNFDYKKVLEEKSVDHIDLADSADVFVIAPATANTIAKLALGIADDVLTTTALAITAPTILCPSMNVNMWNNPAVQQNISILKERGFIIIEPEDGPLACGYTGKGRLANLEDIKKEILTQLKKSSRLQGKKILITAGGSVEPIDDVRSITNKSTGKMGVAIAEACYLQGAKVTLLRASGSVEPRYLVNQETFLSAAELSKKMSYHLSQADIVFHVAAVGDFSVTKQEGKLSSNKSHVLHLEPQQKILDQIKKQNPNVFLVAFKAESALDENQLIEKGKIRLEQSNADVIVANDVSKPDRGFAANTNEVIVISKDKKPYKIHLTSKKAVAEQLLEYLF